MTTQQLAYSILEIRKRPSPFVMSGELLLLLGPQGYQEALNRRWLIHDSENSALRVTHIESFIADMKRLADDFNNPNEDPEVGDSVIVADDGKSYEATVQSREGDVYKLSFPAGKAPLRTLPGYQKNQLRRFARPDNKVPVGAQPVASQQGPPSSTSVYPGLNPQARTMPQ